MRSSSKTRVRYWRIAGRTSRPRLAHPGPTLVAFPRYESEPPSTGTRARSRRSRCQAKRSEAERNTIADAQKIVAIWNARQAGGRGLWFYSTIGAVVAAGLPWLSFSYPACGQFGSVDLRTLDRHPGASISSLIPSASYRRCSPNAPYGGAAVAARRSGSSQMQIGCLHDST